MPIDLAIPESTTSSSAFHVTLIGTFAVSMVPASSIHHAWYSSSICVYLTIHDWAYRISSHIRADVFECDREMDQVKINVSKAPSFVLCMCHFESVFAAVIVVPKLRSDENILSPDESVLNCSTNAFSSFLLVLIIVCAVK